MTTNKETSSTSSTAPKSQQSVMRNRNRPILPKTPAFLRGVTPMQTTHNSSFALVKDDKTGVGYMVPTRALIPSSRVKIVKSRECIMPFIHPQHEIITMRNTNSPDRSPIDVVGTHTPHIDTISDYINQTNVVTTSAEPVYNDLGISEVQPVIDGNEFLNIPPSKSEESNTQVNIVDKVNPSQGNNIVDKVNPSQGNNIVQNTNTIDVYSTFDNRSDKSSECYTNSGTDKILTNLENVENTLMIDATKGDINTVRNSNDTVIKPKIVESEWTGIKNSQVNNESKIVLSTEISSTPVETSHKVVNNRKPSKPNQEKKKKKAKRKSSITGEDLIKMMAVKRSDRQQSSTKLCPNNLNGSIIRKTSVESFNIDNDQKSNTKMISQDDNSTVEPQDISADINGVKELLCDDKPHVDAKAADETKVITDGLDQSKVNDEIAESEDVSVDECDLVVSLDNNEGEMDSSITETEQRIASIVPESMKVMLCII